MSIFSSAFIGGILVGLIPSSSTYFWSIRKTKREDKLKHLEEAYILTKKMESYCAQAPSQMLFLISAMQNNNLSEGLPGQLENPCIRLSLLLDYYLDAPQNLQDKVTLINQNMIGSYRPIAESINNPSQKSELLGKAVIMLLDATQDVPEVIKILISWIKNEKLKTEQIKYSPLALETVNKLKYSLSYIRTIRSRSKLREHYQKIKNLLKL